MRIHALCYLTFNTIESATADKEDVSRVDSNIFLIRMFTTTLGWHIYRRTLQQFQQSLLYTLATHVTRDGRIVGLTGYLVDLVNEHDATLCSLHVVVSHLQQSRQDALDILTDVACLCKHRCVHDGKRDVQQFGNGTCQQGLSRTCRANHDDI